MALCGPGRWPVRTAPRIGRGTSSTLRMGQLSLPVVVCEAARLQHP